MDLLYGKPIAEEMLDRLKGEIFLLEKKPALAVVLVGNDEASKIYVNLKEKAAKKTGIEFFKYLISENADEKEILQLIDFLNKDSEINGIIVQLPLPQKFDAEKIIGLIDKKKDVDGFLGEFKPVFSSAIMLMIESSGERIAGKKAVVICNSDDFGKSMVTILTQKDVFAEYVLAGDISANLGKIGAADVVVSAVGSLGLLRGEMLKDSAILIDGGIEKVNGKVFGDADFASFEGKNGYISPVPGGVGPVTIACLLENTFLAFKAQQKEEYSPC